MSTNSNEPAFTDSLQDVIAEAALAGEVYRVKMQIRKDREERSKAIGKFDVGAFMIFACAVTFSIVVIGAQKLEANSRCQ